MMVIDWKIGIKCRWTGMLYVFYVPNKYRAVLPPDIVQHLEIVLSRTFRQKE